MNEPTPDTLTPPAPSPFPERPSDMLRPWQGVFEVLPSQEDEQLRPLSLHQIVFTQRQAEDDVLWGEDALGLLRVIMAQDEEDRLQSAEHDFLIVEGSERRALQAAHAHLHRAEQDETLISDLLALLQRELALNEDAPGRVVTEVARYRMRRDGSALTRLRGGAEWPLLIPAPATLSE